MSVHFSEPKATVLQLALREGMKVADLGSGSGHYAHAAAAIVGHDGKVYAVEVREDMLKHIKESVHHRHRGIIEPLWGDIERAGGTMLRDQSMDAVILANVLFQIEHRQSLVSEIQRILKPEGKLLVVGWAGSYGGMGPAPDKVVSEHAVEELFIGGGFHKIKSFRAGPHHYALLFSVPAV
ncbi:MAG: methyltransferase domain-containing protein [bacterium]|nr:methyltransferase domain-containing protein [bacterium]